MELTWILTPFPQNSFKWEYKPRCSLCSHAFHRTDSKDPDIYVVDGWMPATKKNKKKTKKQTNKQTNKKNRSMHHPRRRNVTTSMPELKTVTYAKNITKNGELKKHSWGTQKKKKKKKNSACHRDAECTLHSHGLCASHFGVGFLVRVSLV